MARLARKNSLEKKESSCKPVSSSSSDGEGRAGAEATFPLAAMGVENELGGMVSMTDAGVAVADDHASPTAEKGSH